VPSEALPADVADPEANAAGDRAAKQKRYRRPGSVARRR
jgi:hypothetical protein